MLDTAGDRIPHHFGSYDPGVSFRFLFVRSIRDGSCLIITITIIIFFALFILFVLFILAFILVACNRPALLDPGPGFGYHGTLYQYVEQ